MKIFKKSLLGIGILLICYSLVNFTTIAITDNTQDEVLSTSAENVSPSLNVAEESTSNDNSIALSELELHNNELETLSFNEIDNLIEEACERSNNGETNKIDDNKYLKLSHFENNLVNVKTANDNNSSILADKSYIYHKMINTIDYFNTVQGSYISKDNPSMDEDSIEYQCNISKGDGYTHYVSANQDIEYYASGNSVLTVVDNIYDTKEVEGLSPSGDIVISDNDRIKRVEEDGENFYIYRNDPTNVFFANSYSLFPQGLAFGYLADFELWNITGTTQYLNRDCVILEGTSNTEYGAKQGVSRFEMYVDIETGILLQYKGFDSNDNLYCYTITNEIGIDEPVEVKQYEEE